MTKIDDPQKHLQLHTVASGPAIYHGQGAGKDTEKADILRYFMEIDRELHQVLRDEKAPLVLASVDYLQAIYKQANAYPHILDRGIIVNPDTLKNDELRVKALPIVDNIFMQTRDTVMGAYYEARTKGFALSGIRDIVLAAYDGRVESLMVDIDKVQWGRFFPDRRKVRLHRHNRPDSDDLVDLAIVLTMKQRGNVYPVSEDMMPKTIKLAALLRY